MAKKADPFKAKQDRQKKLAIGGGVLLVLMLAIQGPKLLKRLHGGGSEVPAWLAASRQGASGVPAAPGGVSLAAPSLAGGNPIGEGTTAAATGLFAADAASPAGAGQLTSFGSFETKDPFAAQVEPGTAKGPSVPAPPTPSTGAAGSSGTAGGGGGVPNVTPPPGAKQVYTTAVIAVNGTLGTVAADADFGVPLGPAGSTAVPLFHLVSIAAHSVRVAIAGGSYATGAPTITLRQGKPVTLQNTADGTLYTLLLYPQGTPVTGSTTGTTPAASPSGGSGGSGASTGSTGTTTTSASDG